MRVSRLEACTVAPCAGGDDDIDCRHSDTTTSRSTSQIMCRSPDLVVNRKFWKNAREFPQDRPFVVPASTVPEFELDRWTPAGLPCRQSRRHTGTDRWVAGGT